VDSLLENGGGGSEKGREVGNCQEIRTAIPEEGKSELFVGERAYSRREGGPGT